MLEYISENRQILVDLVLLFLLTLTCSTIGNLKTITMIKGSTLQKYSLTFFDALMFGMIMRNINKGDGLLFISVYVLGRMVGMFVTDKLENRVIDKIYLANLYLLDKYLQEIQEYLLIEGISFTKLTGKFMEKDRILLTIHLNELQKTNLLNKLKEMGIQNPNIDFIEVKSVYGSIKERTKEP